jgi:hypothetical protein
MRLVEYGYNYITKRDLKNALILLGKRQNKN